MLVLDRFLLTDLKKYDPMGHIEDDMGGF